MSAETETSRSEHPRKVAVVAHTHWDREWYSPFEVYRARLVEVVDQILDTLESDPSFTHFLLDGQVAVADDYLEVRPGSRARLEEMIRARRLAIGPWYVLPDEFCVSAETLVRNLQLGLSRAEKLGGSSGVGYLPDMFGHIGQMPQILRLNGLEHAVVWRGVPSAVEQTAFRWSGPDGSSVRAEYLPVGYANGASLPYDTAAFLRRVETLAEEIAAFLPTGWPLLLMNGNDHSSLQSGLPELLERANAARTGFSFAQGELRTYLDSAPDAISTWQGELRSGARANLLMGVLSTRVDIKTAAAAAERELEKIAEPLCALWLPADLWPADLLDPAWLGLIRNSAHDSICGCSADPVARAVLTRYDSSRALAAVATDRALEMASLAMRDEGLVILNPSPFSRAGVVELTLRGGGDAPQGGQILETVASGVEIRTGLGGDLGRILGELAGDGWLGGPGRPTLAAIVDSDDELRLYLGVDATRATEPSTAAVMAEAWAAAGAGRARPLTVEVHREASRRVAVPVPTVPGYGWCCWEPRTPQVPPVEDRGPHHLHNGLVDVRVDPDTGTFALGDLSGMDLLVDEADLGDTYNFSPGATPGSGPNTSMKESPTRVEVRTLEHGPARGRIEIIRSYGRGSEGSLTVRTVLEILAGDPLLRVVATVDNRRLDHRLRALFPLPLPASETLAECAFSSVSRGHAEGGPHEPALATYPSRRFVSAGGLTLFHEGLLEHELIDGGGFLALTLLRCTGILSRPAPPARPNRAGPATLVPGAQMQGLHELRYALAVGDVDPWDLAETAWSPLVVLEAPGGGSLPRRGSRLAVGGAQVSALRRRGKDGPLEIRLFNPTPAETEARLPGCRGTLVDLRDDPLDTWVDTFAIRPWGIATAHLDSTAD